MGHPLPTYLGIDGRDKDKEAHYRIIVAGPQSQAIFPFLGLDGTEKAKKRSAVDRGP